MTDDDPLRTRREVTTPLTAELATAGFENAVEIGRGGFGVVYRCRQVALDRTVAVKVLSAELDADNQARFAREQRAMGRLTAHPNIVTVLETGAIGSGQPFLVMPYHPLNSLDAWIRQHGPLPLERVLSIGVKIAGALASAHRLGIVHRDVKPGNILLTEYGEPALTDFGIAHIAGGFQTAAGIVTGSPAFTAPEVLEGVDPTPAADVYGLGATLFCALTGHAAFERHSGENVVAQFVRMSTQPVPDLREKGLPEDVSALVEAAMSRDRHERPSAAALGEAIRQVQQGRGFSVGEMALLGESDLEHPDGMLGRRGEKPPSRGWRTPMAAARDHSGELPLELTSFVGRRAEVSQLKKLLSASRLVTLTGIGGVGKTRLALRAATQVRRDFADGVWLVELAEVSDPALLVDVMAAALGVRNQSAAPLLEVLTDFLASRETLLVVDNCEHVVEAVAGLTETLLRTCPDLRILATSREPLNIAGETVLRVAPLLVPDPEREPTLAGLPRFDAVTLFADRAAAAVPDFELDEGNKAAVAGICAQVDGLPLAIELAAARMRTMSPEQILARLTDRYALLTRGSRTAPARQQTLRWCIAWSYELCTRAEQQLWARLSVFAGSFELDAAEEICGPDRGALDAAAQSPLDVLSALVDKSILIREQSHSVVRIRMLETLRDYGREKLRESGEDTELRRRHRDWYQRMALNAEAEWISPRQPDWIARLEREQPNLREALESCLTDNSRAAAEAGLRIVSALHEFWSFRGLYGEGRFWIDRVLAHPGAQSIPDRISALRAACEVAAPQGDFQATAAFLAEGRALAAQDPTPAIEGQLAYATGIVALAMGEAADASSSLERAVDLLSADPTGELYVSALAILAWSYELRGDMTRACEHYRRVLSITEARGELLYRATALRGLGVAARQQGERDRAQRLLEEALRINRRSNSPVLTAFGIEALAWTVADRGDVERAAVLLGAAQGNWLAGGSVRAVLLSMSRFHKECERTTRGALGARRFDAAFRQGQAMGVDAAVAYALGEQPTDVALASGPAARLTKRERQVADLVAQGLSNKQIANKLVVSQRTVQGHVEHILTKLGFTSRTQIAAWFVEQARQASS
ncbi:protein kinase domain-containing protein [Nocardia gamkensis]|uniref:Protein kinase n=2 Tax=Nocardia gamkensis TaxID=352869 RepID=A0A7X6L029_9NOCA|nr:protein kinase [Nocardia gamkensis]NKY25263.1 protein kinase [Nocardia gamkensis]NQE70259.1 Serine/threonine-protein kinase PknK [Nocardia gamkensis]